MSIIQLLSLACAIIVIVLPIIFTVINIKKIIKKTKSLRFETIAFTLGIVLAVFAYALLEPVNYQDAINASNGPVLHEAFNQYHLLTLLVFWGIGLLAYFILKFHKKTFPPLVEAVLMSGVYIGIIVSVFVCIQLIAGFKADYAYIFIIVYLYLFLLNYFLLSINLLINIAGQKAEEQKELNYKNAFLQNCSKWLYKGVNAYIGAVVFMIPLLALLVIILTLFGQQPDSVIKAFTETSDWILSTKVSPPPIENGGHYLCTVSLRGHEKLVKPVRYGIRNGNRIVVNRQLCISNAFEQLIMEKTPKFHRAIRNFYDTYGYPVSKLIKRAWVADIIYLIMKPLEWLFLIVLYTFDQKPEDRIAKQYLPKIN